MQLKAAVISLGSKSSKAVVEALKAYFKVVDNLLIKDVEVHLTGEQPQILYKGENIDNYDCVYIKGSFRYSDLARSIAMALPATTYTPISESSFTITHDKILTQLVLQKHHVPTPKTYVTSSAEAARKLLDRLHYPIIMKFPKGTQGKGVMVADSMDSASSMMDALGALKQPFLIQEYIDTGGTDVRIVVIGDKIGAAMKRKALRGETRANIHAGGIGEKYEPDGKTKNIAAEAANVLGVGICGIDILESHLGPLVIEANASPGLQGITEVTKVDVAGKIASFLHRQTIAMKEAKNGPSADRIFMELGIKEAGKEILTNLDFRANRILLPEIITRITGFSEKDEVMLVAKKKHLAISEFQIGNDNT